MRTVTGKGCPGCGEPLPPDAVRTVERCGNCAGTIITLVGDWRVGAAGEVDGAAAGATHPGSLGAIDRYLVPPQLAQRYEVGDVLGVGAMGMVDRLSRA